MRACEVDPSDGSLRAVYDARAHAPKSRRPAAVHSGTSSTDLPGHRYAVPRAPRMGDVPPFWTPPRAWSPSSPPGRRLLGLVVRVMAVALVTVALSGAAPPRGWAAPPPAPRAPAAPQAPGPGPPAAGGSGAAGPAAEGWGWPLTGRPAVVTPCRPPPAPWLAGHRGVDLAGSPGQPVLSAGSGVVAFAGSVAGVPVVSVDHRGGLRTTYQPVIATVRRGDDVQRGAVLGALAAAPSHCAPAACLHWGLRRGDAYLDPLALLGVDLRVRLLPVWGR